MKALEFDLRRKACPVTLIGEDGKKKEYTLKEMTGTQRDIYMEKVVEKIIIGKDGKPKEVTSMKGVHALVISLSLFDADDNPVSIEFVNGFTTKVQDGLFDAATKLSALGQESVDEVGNES